MSSIELGSQIDIMLPPSLRDVSPREVPHPFNQVAEEIGGDVNAERVADLIKKANEGRFLFHGIRSRDSLEPIREQGIAPITPEGGFVSFWTSGSSLFIGETKMSGRINTRDTSFFDYGHSTLAVTTVDTIQEHTGREVIFNKNRQHTLPFIVPSAALSLILVNNSLSIHGRSGGQLVEQTMFSALEDVINAGFQPGIIEKDTLFSDLTL